MPISGGSGGSFFQSLANESSGELGSLFGTGFPAYRYAKAAAISLSPNQPTLILAETEEKSLREINIKNNSDVSVELRWTSDNISYPFATLPPGHFLQDSSDGGLRLEAISTEPAELYISVRAEVEIYYEIGREIMPFFPVEVGLHIGTGENFDYTSQSVQDAVSSVFDSNINRLFNSDYNMTGWKLASFKMFTPGEEIEFNIQVEGEFYSDTLNIQFQWINIFAVGRLLLAVGSDVINPESQSIDSSVAGVSTKLGYAGEVSGNGGVLKIRPNFLNLVGRFAAVSTASEKYDTAIIKTYIPSADPLKGGTFVLEGF